MREKVSQSEKEIFKAKKALNDVEKESVSNAKEVQNIREEMKRLRLDFDKNANDQFDANKKYMERIENAHQETLKDLKKEFFDIITQKDKELAVKKLLKVCRFIIY